MSKILYKALQDRIEINGIQAKAGDFSTLEGLDDETIVWLVERGFWAIVGALEEDQPLPASEPGDCHGC